MGLVADLKKKIEKKQQQIAELQSHQEEIEVQIREATAALQAFQEVLKITPKDEDGDETAEPNFRAGSTVALARDALRKHGKPMHVSKLIEAIGKQPTHKEKVSLSGSLSAYVRLDQVFTRPQPNVFGLREWETKDKEMGDVVEMLQASSK